MNKIAVIGSLTFDITVVAKHIPKQGESLIGTTLFKSPGGKGVNQATTAQRLGIQTAMVGCIGDDEFGNIIGEVHRNSGMNVEHLFTIPNQNTGFASIFVDEAGNNSIIVVPGSNMDLTPTHVDQAIDILKKCEIVMTQMEIPLETTLYTLQKSKELGKITILNPAPAQKIPDNSYKYIDYLTPNETELEILTGISVKTPEDALKGARILQEKGAKTIIVTLGEQGALLVEKDSYHHIPAVKVVAIDTVAAGDCFNGGFAVALVKGKSIMESVRAGTISAAVAVTKPGALSSLPTLVEITDFCTSKNIENPFV